MPHVCALSGLQVTLLVPMSLVALEPDPCDCLFESICDGKWAFFFFSTQIIFSDDYLIWPENTGRVF